MKFTHIFYSLMTGALLLLLAACSKKEDNFLYNAKMLPINVSGYNGGENSLEVKVDTFKFSSDIGRGTFSQGEAYTFPADRNSVMVTVKEKVTGKLLLEREVKKEDRLANIRFMYMDGKVGNMPELPPVEAGKLKLTYLFKPTLTHYSQPVDIALMKYYFTPKVLEEVARIKNVKPNEFSEVLTTPTFSTAVQPYNGQNTSVLSLVYIYKAGTNELYTEGTSYTWNVTASTAPKPNVSVASSKLYIFSENAVGNSIRFIKDLEL